MSLKLIFQDSGIIPVCQDLEPEGAVFTNIEMARLLGIPRMSDSGWREELDTCKEQVLGKHIDDLPGGVISEAVP